MNTRSALWRSRRTLLFTTLFAVSVVLANTDPALQSRIRMKALDAAAPMSCLFARAAQAVGQLVSLGRDDARREELRRLRERNAELQDKVRQLTDLLEDAGKTLKAVPEDFLVEVAPILLFESAQADIIAHNPGLFSSSAVILGDRKSGLRNGLGVVRGGQVVGKVVEVGDFASQVRFIYDPDFRMYARIERTGQMALLAGAGESCRLTYMPPDANVRDGDLVVSTGIDDVFPPGLLIGRIKGPPRPEAFLTIGLECDLATRSLESVFILHKKRAQPGSSPGDS